MLIFLKLFLLSLLIILENANANQIQIVFWPHCVAVTAAVHQSGTGCFSLQLGQNNSWNHIGSKMSHRTSPSPSALGTVLEFDRIRITTRAKFTFSADMPDLKVRGYGPKDQIEIGQKTPSIGDRLDTVLCLLCYKQNPIGRNAFNSCCVECWHFANYNH